MNKGKGNFITFEGPEGSGKTLQIKLLAGELDRRGIAYTTTKEPGGTEFGREVRDILLKNGGASRSPVAELMLYLADRCHRAEKQNQYASLYSDRFTA